MRRLHLCAAFVSVALAAGPASAQSPYRLDVQHLHPSAIPESGLAVEGGRSLSPWVFSAGASFHFGSRLLRAEDPGGMEQAVLLDHQAVLEPAFALSLPLGFAIELAWPFVLAAADTESARAITLAELRGQGIGDPRIGLSWRLEPVPDVTLLAGATVTVPTLGSGQGPWAELGSEPGASLSGRVGAEGRIAIVVLRANVGVRGRFEDASLGSAFNVGSELTFGAGGEVRPIPELHVFAELHGSSAFDGFFTRDKTPVELIGGVRILPIRDFEILPFGGVGLTEGYGTPSWRVGLTLRVYPHMRDADGDGVADDSDRCAGGAEDRDGFQDDDGCADPDNDGDGVLDANDECPTVAGLGRFAGCPDPDADHDGVLDELDRCPDQTEDQDGFEDDDGCPELDNDNDGMPDADDRCPNQAEDLDGFEDEDGCAEADNDRDRIADVADRCPRVAEDLDGFEDEDGCPELDNDGDGVPDTEDGPADPGGMYGVCRNLPETAGGRDANDPDGCPDTAVSVDVAARRIRVPPVFFDTDADVIQQRSFADLVYVSEVLAANAWIQRLIVEGHTDDRGSDEHNLDLSRRRAASVVRFLVENGVAADRLEPQGFGRGRPPTADDHPACRRPTSSACRQAARRVVFRISAIETGDAPPSEPGAGPSD